MSKREDFDLSEDQIAHIKRSFALLDQNGDGRISRTEVIKAAQLLGLNPTKRDADKMLREFDKNQNGFVEFDEYLKVMKRHFEPELDIEKERLITAFKTIDKNGNGFITKEDLRFALRCKDTPFSDKEVEELLQDADTNQDGKIDYKEFVVSKMCHKLF
ncbi:hypothetical protein ScPMuIL_007497 [Solemya velum]